MKTPALSIKNLSKTYEGINAVNDISFTIDTGEIFGLLGPNGAGKSTTINMIGGVTHIGSGTIEIFGHDNRSDYRMTRRMVGVMHQEIVIDNFFTIDQALRFHAGYYGVPDDAEWRQHLIERLGLKPHLHKVMIKLSGGLKRRFMIAKALIHKPKLLILDEPTAGVDVELRLTLWNFVREINQQGTTILLTTHYLEEAEQMCDRIAIMNHGNLIALEKTETLLKELGTRSILVHLEEPIDTVPEDLTCQDAELLNGGRTLQLTMSANQPTGDLLKKLCDRGLPIEDIETQKAGLEKVFLQITQTSGEKP
ncbi:MAG: ABC transporter ATP-binding protein [Gammaproteobacteria bacterium]|nr:ABC transporter ATP-binding protein [Gammaproteobacteria bacterium]NIQ12783.1 ABC transporter ATP-binding protein [Gammaproteobacteria bacterium]NIR25839.1 ABC transporter ATP-binding protein [Gammaproteobacteria bacterium]NIY20814.1 ATP-binding cassette domain-containing protein [Gammaproteobacteria bacterium]